MLAIVDHGVGNLRSLTNAFEAVGAAPELVADADALGRYPRIVLPGVGAIGEALAHLERSGLGEAVIAAARAGTPVLGICLGMQLLCSRSLEGGDFAALDLIGADVLPLAAEGAVKVPHIGWNAISLTRAHPLVDGVADGTDVYFVHSFHVQCHAAEDALALTDYGLPFASMIARDNVMGAQFHPEKSQSAGLRMLQNFLAL